VSNEEHPFTLSSSPENKFVRLSIKDSGDFTSTLKNLEAGERAVLYGPYGEFGKKVFSNKMDNIFIAGGIGITPFLSILNYIADKKNSKNINLIWVFRGKDETVYKKELISLSNKIKGLKVKFHNSAIRSRFTINHDLKLKNIHNKIYLICGPKSMMHDLVIQLTEIGVNKKDIIMEDFDLKN
jgi:predicted ferric reductase